MEISTTNINCNNSFTLVDITITSDSGEILKETTERIAFASTLKDQDPILIEKIELLKVQVLEEFNNFINANYIDVADFLFQKSEAERKTNDFKGKQKRIEVDFHFSVLNFPAFSVFVQTNPSIEYEVVINENETKTAKIYLDTISDLFLPTLTGDTYKAYFQIFDFNEGQIQ